MATVAAFTLLRLDHPSQPRSAGQADREKTGSSTYPDALQSKFNNRFAAPTDFGKKPFGGYAEVLPVLSHWLCMRLTRSKSS
jgi:hypothetical protein